MTGDEPWAIGEGPEAPSRLDDDALLEALASAVASADAGSGPAGRAGPAVEVPGCILRREIHRGAQGVVYEAWHDRTKRPVAVKVLLSGVFATTAERERFIREAELAASISHPGVVVVHDSGTTPEGRGYLVMELVEGRAIDAWADERRPASPRPGRRAWAEVLGVVAGACEAVQAAHRRGVIHRDLKPSNILVDADGRPRVVDFGTAKRTPAGGEVGGGGGVGEEWRGATLTQEGGFVGSIAYAAPEQIRGGAAAADTRADVYALGMILWRVLAGRHPIDPAASLPDVIARAARGIETPPSRANPAVDAELDAIALQALAPEPDRRYGSAQALADDLRRYLAGEPVEAKRASGWYRARVFVRRHAVLVAAASIFWITVAGFASAMAVLYAREKQARSAAETAFGTVFGTLEATDPERADGGPRVATIVEFLDEASRVVDQSLAGHPLARADAQARIGRAYLSRDEHRRALDVLEEVLRTRRRQLGPRHLAVAEALEDVGRARWDTDGYQDAADAFREALDIRLARPGPEDPAAGVTMHLLASTLNRLGRYDEAEKLYERAMPVLARGLPSTADDLASAWNSYGVLLRHRGRVDEARTAAERALQILERHAGEDDWRVARGLSSLAAYLGLLHEWDEAERTLGRALAITERRGGAGTADAATLHGRIARLGLDRWNAAASQGEPGDPAWLERAVRSADRTLELRRRIYGGEHPQIAEALALRGQVRLAAGDASAAVEDLAEAADVYRLLLPDDTWEVGRTRAQLGLALLADARPAEGVAELRAAHAALRAAVGDDHPTTRWAAEVLRDAEAGIATQEGR